ncbi:DUF2306 domain-containing protein [Paracoccus caeni]|uniref:DUF2306 domain-containing protein n=1 Tax=Paracoccus caeni TaxID=657651 RepID=A0A934SBR4_9RHOB|nr:DUF2306 domain-containing protein [Paracoccus caeni]MBK4215960.1 DUF2306 domain-containing protein [Paracoccus caeni]
MKRDLGGLRMPGFGMGFWPAALTLLFAAMGGFIAHSVWLGLGGLTNDLQGRSPFYAASMPLTTAIMFLHMITGALLTVIAPLQVINPIRRNWPRFHRWSGRIMVGLGIFTGFGGILYATRHGTTGGAFMDLSSTVYGLLMLLAAVQTYRLGRARKWMVHRRWGWRFTVLVIASWLYRMHYVIWDRLTGGLWTTPDMTGPFDRFQAWAFYLSYAALLELWFLWEDRRRMRKRPQPAMRPAPAGTG